MPSFSFRRWIKDSFRVSEFGLEHPSADLFVTSQWQWHPLIYVLWRSFLAVYFFVWIILSGAWEYPWYDSQANRLTWFVYLTNWSFLFYVLMLIIQAALAIIAFSKRRTQTHPLGVECDAATSLPWYIKMQWVFYNIGSAAALDVTVIFYAYFVSPGDYVHPVDFHTHGINGGMVLVDLFITGHPVRPLHVIHSLLLGLIYLIFSVIYTMAGGTNGVSKSYIYVFFDWKEDPGMAVVHSLVFCVFGVIIAWLVMCCGYVLRQLLNECLISKEIEEENVECVVVTKSNDAK